MDFGSFRPLSKPAGYASAEAVVYRQLGHREVQILTSERRIPPWEGHTSLTLGGYVDPGDPDLIATAVREVREETGGEENTGAGLKVRPMFVVGVYGPGRFHYTLRPARMSVNGVDFEAVSTKTHGHILPVVTHVFGMEVVGGEIRESSEQGDFRWLTPSEIVGSVTDRLAFDHGRVLYDFCSIMYGPYAGMQTAVKFLEFFARGV